MFKNIVVFTLILVGAFPVLAFAAYKLPDTGQGLCYPTDGTTGQLSTCVGTGQDGEYDFNPLSYFTDNGNGTVTDNNTGLMWQKNSQPDYYNWYEAAGIHNEIYNSSNLNACSSIGNGWRLPTLKELISILDFSGSNVGLTIDSSFSCANDGRYWANTDNNTAQSVDFNFGTYYASEDPSNGLYHVRCVRDQEVGPPVRQKLVNSLVGTVTDTSTGLMWLKTPPPGPMTLGASLSYCQTLNVEGTPGWRLPNIKELESWLTDTRALNMDFFSGALTDDFYWTSTTDYVHSDDVLGIDVRDGTMSPRLKDDGLGNMKHYVQCVRSIPKVLDGDLNGDEQVTIIDVLLALRAVVDLDAKTQFYFDHADIAPINSGTPTKDNAITPADALLILQKAVGLVSW
ncbi:MAG: DUF1566 domain-containing protein [Geobacteraceae bacterium]|nr:DUF1566 domain-containing protein [Geobacteraceae bacterium]